MRELLEITVTDADISKGMQCDSHRCPIAQAVMRELVIPDPDRVLVRYRAIEVIVGGESHYYALPGVALSFIDDFDEGLKVSPFAFTARPVPIDVRF